MSDEKQPKRPTHDIFVVREGKDKSHWTKIGAAWTNEDGQGLTLLFDALPVSGRAVLRVVKERDEQTANAGGQR